jgi:hypothetical protein
VGLFGLVDQPLVGDRGDEFGVTLVSQVVGDVWMHGVLLGMSSGSLLADMWVYMLAS